VPVRAIPTEPPEEVGPAPEQPPGGLPVPDRSSDLRRYHETGAAALAEAVDRIALELDTASRGPAAISAAQRADGSVRARPHGAAPHDLRLRHLATELARRGVAGAELSDLLTRWLETEVRNVLLQRAQPRSAPPSTTLRRVVQEVAARMSGWRVAG